MRKRWWIGLLALAMLLCLMPAVARAENEPKAKEYTKYCKIDCDVRDGTRHLLNWFVTDRVAFPAETGVTISWTDEYPVAYLCLQWFTPVEGVIVRAFDGDGQLMAEEKLGAYPEYAIPLPEGTRSARVTAGEAGMDMSQLHVFGEGTLPDPFHLWQETPEGLDYLLIATHPDDDVLYLGSIVPIYGAEQGYVGSIAYATCMTRGRMSEAENGAWEMGLRYRPLFMGFPDIPRDAKPEKKAEFVYDDLVRDTVRLYRRYHPAVVFAQAVHGEYGHWQHVLTSKASVEAYDLAADPTYDPESVESYGTWQVQKLYLHDYEENKLYLDGNVPLAAFDGTTAWNVARKAFQKHESQTPYGFFVMRDDQQHAFNRFGMIKGVVEAGDDAFANIPPELLSTYDPSAPKPTEAPSPEPTPAPTPADPS